MRVQAADRGYPNPAKSMLTLFIIVQDKNDHKPEFIGLSIPHEIVVIENTTKCADVNLATDRDINATFNIICYYLIGWFLRIVNL